MGARVASLSGRRAALLILLAGCAVRLVALGTYPGGVNQDEAYLALEINALLHTGADLHGYVNPVYFSAWGGGMNVLYAYLALPFVRVFGDGILVLRLPQALAGCGTLVVFGCICRRALPRRGALIALGLLAVNPWHIMMCRWALESNLVVFFLTAGLWFWLQGLEKPGWMLACAACYGLALYCYATAWPVVPLLVAGQAVYARRCGLLRFHWAHVAAAGLLALLAAPLVLFLLVNTGWLPEIRTAVLSIPKLPALRADRYSLSSLPANIATLFRLFSTQSDGWGHNALPEFGLHYLFSTPLILLGLVCLARDGLRSWRERVFAPAVTALVWVCACGPGLVLMSEANINRANAVHLPLLFCGAWGLVQLFAQVWNKIGYAALAACALSFVGFCGVYFSSGPMFAAGYDQALDTARRLATADIYVQDINYANVLYAAEYPPAGFQREVEYANYPDPWLDVVRIGRWVFHVDTGAPDPAGVYVFHRDNAHSLEALLYHGYTVNLYDDYYVAFHPPDTLVSGQLSGTEVKQG